MFNLLSRPKKPLSDAGSPKTGNKIVPGRIKRFTYPGAVYDATGARGDFHKSEYDLGEVAKVMDIEAYARQAFNKHVEMCLKEGYQIKSRNPEATLYIKKRLSEIGEASGRTFSSLLRGIITNIVQYANCFVVKARSTKSSSGAERIVGENRVLAPVAGYFLLDPTSIEISRDEHGKVLAYKQNIPGASDFPEFKPENVIHIYYDRKEGFAFGTPYVIPVIDDIRTLRRMEENIEMLLQTHLYPLFQYIVGTENHPAEVYDDGTSEVDLIKQEIENMPTEGSIVTPERHEIRVIGAEGKAIAADPYLRHFELRVLAGLGISEVALGRGGTANRATSATIDKFMQDRCKDFQDVVEEFVNEYMMKELLLEGGYSLDPADENLVRLQFNEIDIDSMLKVENHSVFKYEHDAITESELRELLGKDPITEEQRGDMYFEHVVKPKAIILAVDEPWTAEAKTAIGSKGAAGVGGVEKVSKEEKKKREATQREKPANQHGVKPAKTAVKKDELLVESIRDLRMVAGEDVLAEDLHHNDSLTSMDTSYNSILMSKLYDKMLKHWDLTKEDVSDYIRETYIEENRNFRDFTPEKLKMILFLTRDSVVKDSGLYVFQAFKDGVDRAAKDSGREKIDLHIDPSIKYKYLEERIEYYTNSLLSDLGAQLIKNINPEFSDDKEFKELRREIIPRISGIFDALKYRLRFTAHTEIMKSYNFGYAFAMRDLGYKELYLKLSDNHCNMCNDAKSKPLSLEYFAFEDIAPLHPMCNCLYTTRKE